MKQPTEYKECNVVVIEKLTKKTGGDNQTRYEIEDRWTGAMYGKRALFASYVHEAGMRMGQLDAGQVVFIADGAKHNWEIQMDNFHDAIQILDVYHALEHLGDYCDLFENKPHGKQKFGRWRKMMLAADTLQLLHEMKEHRKSLSNRDEGQKHINYFLNNIDRMAYDTYRAMGFPIGSGLVEGSCKLVVGKRFKGNGMRWKLDDNKAVLRTRLAELNDQLEAAFAKKTRKHSFVEPQSTYRQPDFAHA